MKLSEAQLYCLESLLAREGCTDPMSVPPIVTSDREHPRGVATASTARSLADRGLVNWAEGATWITLTDAGRRLVSEGLGEKG